MSASNKTAFYNVVTNPNLDWDPGRLSRKLTSRFASDHRVARESVSSATGRPLVKKGSVKLTDPSSLRRYTSIALPSKIRARSRWSTMMRNADPSLGREFTNAID
jgi:hypothetical protein